MMLKRFSNGEYVFVDDGACDRGQTKQIILKMRLPLQNFRNQ